MGKSINQDVATLNAQQGRKQLPLKELSVLKTVKTAPDTFSVFLSVDAAYDVDMASILNMSKAQHTSFIAKQGVYFPVGSGLGIPPPQIDSPVIERIYNGLRDAQKTDRDYLTPHHGYAAPDLSSPSKALLEAISKAAQNHPQLGPKAQRLKNILSTPAELSELQSTYDVADIIAHFPQILSAKDIWLAQPAGSMTKTYTIIPEAELSKAEGKPCFSISVKLQKASSPQRLFGETANTAQTHQGAVSSYLCALKAGDALPVVDIVKPQKAYKAPYEAQRDVMFITQGNAHERALSYLHEKQASKSPLKQSFILVSGFKEETDIPKNKAFKQLAQDGTLTRIYYALSRDKKAPRIHGHEHYCTGKRATDIVNDIDLDNLNSPVFYIAGSNDFCAAVETQLKNKLGERIDVRISNSKTRIQKPSSPC
jgi:ferredoxin-NADP reductase